ncbi:hypothetical protein AN395_02616 [Pseudoalteromonas sp. P1-30]|nr:hypothetical protein AN395_02616 [Pseudoalteromonas sp. P1-30]
MGIAHRVLLERAELGAAIMLTRVQTVHRNLTAPTFSKF